MLGCCETEREKNLVLLLSSVYVCALVHSSPLTVGVNGNSFLCYNNIVSRWWKLLYFLYPDTHRLCECITEGVCKCKLIGLSHCSWSVNFIFSVWSPWDETAAIASEWNRDGNKFWDKSLWLQKWLSANVRLAWWRKCPCVCLHRWMFFQCFTSSKLWIVTQFNFQVCTLTITQH